MRVHVVRVRALLALTALAVALCVPASASAVPVATDAFTLDATKDSVVAGVAIHPQAVYSAGRTYIAFQGPGLRPYVAAYDHTTHAWIGTYVIGVAGLVNDLHGVPALLVDSDGYIHAFWGGHATPLMHARTANPRDISSWVRLADVTPKYTYSQPIRLPDGTIDIFYRGDGYDWQYRRSTDNGISWSSPIKVLDQVGNYGFYAHFERGQGSEILASWEAMNWDDYFSGRTFGRTNVYFMRRDTAGVWRNAAGAPVTLPLMPSTQGAQARIYMSGGANTNWATAKAAPNGDPCVLFTTGSGGGPTSYH
ncbi:MAG: hypothetical protein FDZ75_06400, partial [Actinobacteria bacterium]